MQRRDVGNQASVGRHRRGSDGDRIESRSLEDSAVDEREEGAVTGAANRLTLEPPIAERALLVRAPRLEGHVALTRAGDDEREPEGRRLAEIAVGEIGSA